MIASVRVLEVLAAVGLFCALIWALLSAIAVSIIGMTTADLAHQPEYAIAYPGANLESELSYGPGFDILFSGPTPAKLDRLYRTSAPPADVLEFYSRQLESS